MNLSPRWVQLLRDAGWECLHWSQGGSPGASDSEIMAYAAANLYVVVTHDLDFGAILAANHGGKPSVVQIRSEDISPEGIGNQVVTALRNDASRTGSRSSVNHRAASLAVPVTSVAGRRMRR